MRFHFLLARRTPDVPSRIILDVSEILREQGHQVECSIPEEALISLHVPPRCADLYLLKSYTELSLSLAGALDAAGAHLVNPYAGCAAARNKIVCYQVLRGAGVPVPRSWLTADPNCLKDLLCVSPLILKPHMGWRGEGIRVVRQERDLAGFVMPPGPLLIQEYIENNGEDLRVYVAGNAVFGIRKRFTSSSFAVDGESVPVTPEIREIALRCGRAFRLTLYGIDVIEGVDGPKVVDVNYFPGYKGVPGAADAVAECITGQAALFRRSPQRETDAVEVTL